MKHFFDLRERATRAAWYANSLLRAGDTQDAIVAAKIADEWAEEARRRFWEVNGK